MGRQRQARRVVISSQKTCGGRSRWKGTKGREKTIRRSRRTTGVKPARVSASASPTPSTCPLQTRRLQSSNVESQRRSGVGT